MINRILVVNPSKRITIEEIKNHKFYQTGQELLKKKDKNVDKYAISNIVFDQMIKMGYVKDDILENLAENFHNNITATFYLLFNKVKKEIYYKGNSKSLGNKIAPLSKLL
jgi:5'-AMP-activated protein kinase catalytic alpha subunit